MSEKINLSQTAFHKCNKFAYGILGLHYSANEIFSGEKFYDEIRELSDEYNWFRLEDVVAEHKFKNQNETKLLRILDKIDEKLQILPFFLYNSLSPKSFKNNNKWIYHPLRSRELTKNKYELKNILFCDYRFKKDNEIKKLIFDSIEKEHKILELKEFKIDNYNWYLIKLIN